MIDCIIFWNVRSLNDHKMRSIIKGFMSRWKLALICLQEAKMDAFLDNMAYSLWKIMEVDEESCL